MRPLDIFVEWELSGRVLIVTVSFLASLLCENGTVLQVVVLLSLRYLCAWSERILIVESLQVTLLIQVRHFCF